MNPYRKRAASEGDVNTSSRRHRTGSPTRRTNVSSVNPNPNPSPSTAGETNFRLSRSSELNQGLNQLFQQMNESNQRQRVPERESVTRREINLVSEADETLEAARVMIDRHREADSHSRTYSSNRPPSGGNEEPVARDLNDDQSSGSETTHNPNTNGRRGEAAVRFNSSNPEEDRCMESQPDKQESSRILMRTPPMFQKVSDGMSNYKRSPTPHPPPKTTKSNPTPTIAEHALKLPPGLNLQGEPSPKIAMGKATITNKAEIKEITTKVETPTPPEAGKQGEERVEEEDAGMASP